MTRRKPVPAAKAAVFSLEEAKVQLLKKSDGLDKIDGTEVLSIDLDLRLETSNAVLAEFHPALRSCLYAKKDESQGDVIPDPDHLTVLRFPQFGPLNWDTKMEGVELRFHKGSKASGAVVFADAKVGKFKLDCRDGGTVVVSFQAQVYPDETQAGRLSGFLQDKHCILTLIPAEAGEASGQRPLA